MGHGRILNASELGRLMEISSAAARHRIDLLTKQDLLRLLYPLQAGLKKRMVKSPKLYVRDTGLLLHLLGIQQASEILEGYMIEKIICRERAGGEERFFYYSGFSGKHIALILDRTPSGVGIRFRAAELLGPPGNHQARSYCLYGKQELYRCPGHSGFPQGLIPKLRSIFCLIP